MWDIIPLNLHPRLSDVLWANKMSLKRDQGEKIFETWHISTISGLASQNLKNSLTYIWNCEKSVRMRRWKLSLIEERFEIPNPSIHILNKEENVLYLQRQSSSQEELTLRVSKIRRLSLQDMAASKFCERIASQKQIQSLLEKGEIPHSVTDILLKYL